MSPSSLRVPGNPEMSRVWFRICELMWQFMYPSADFDLGLIAFARHPNSEIRLRLRRMPELRTILFAEVLRMTGLGRQYQQELTNFHIYGVLQPAKEQATQTIRDY